jgi:hypothetical protein
LDKLNLAALLILMPYAPPASPPIYEAVMICRGYADFAAWTIPAAKNQFERMVVVTDQYDLETQKLCEFWNVEAVITDAFSRKGEKFNKGAAINAGLDRLSRKGWILHLDADIWLPPQTMSIVRRLDLDPSKIYGTDRLDCKSFDKWIDYLCKPEPIQESWVFIHPNRFPISPRLAEYKTHKGGYEPIGFFQLWNPEISGCKDYPDEHGTADRTDVLHAKKWPRRQRELLPEVPVIHLDTSEIMGANWGGRRSPRFAPQLKSKRLTVWQKICRFFA